MREVGFLGLDLGGTGAKAGVYDENGRALGFGSAGYSPVATADGLSEIPIEQIRDGARESVREAVAKSGARVRAMAISSQGQTFAPLDGDYRSTHPAIMWYDSRGIADTEDLGNMLVGTMPPEEMPYIHGVATVGKILWLRKHRPDAVARARYYALLPEYVALQLTGRFVTEPWAAASSGLYAEDAPDYCAAALDAAGVGRSQLPEIAGAGSPIGTVRPEAAREWGLSDDTILVAGTNDQYAGALGAGNHRPGIVSETTGTCLALVTLARTLPDPMPAGLFGGRFPIPEYRFALAYSKTAGLVLDWFSRGFCGGASLAELDKMAAGVPPGSLGITVLPHMDGTASPKPDDAARGCIANLTLSHGPAEVYRGMLESITFSLRENLEMMQDAGLSLDSVRSIGGGAKSGLWLQMKADVTGLPIERPAVSEAATLGAAMIAAVGAGRFGSINVASRSLYRAERTFEPDPEAHEQYEEPYRRYRELCRKVYGWE